jgi:hypothetical protein
LTGIGCPDEKAGEVRARDKATSSVSIVDGVPKSAGVSVDACVARSGVGPAFGKLQAFIPNASRKIKQPIFISSIIALNITSSPQELHPETAR